ncbi:MAG: O-antigen ligase family protein [Pseudomonadota bacterium]
MISGRLASLLRAIALVIFFSTAIMFGGASREGLAAHSVLQIIGSGLLVSATLAPGSSALNRHAWAGLALASLLVVISLMGLLPLPYGLWSGLGVRAQIGRLQALIGADGGWKALSLSPELTRASAFAVLAPIGALFTAAQMRWRRASVLIPWTFVALGGLSAAFGLVQVFLGSEAPVYLFEVASRGLPGGPFANVNHQATFLLMCLPFVFALAGQLRQDWRAGDAEVGRAILLSGTALVLIVGVMAAGSVAGYILLAVVGLLSLSLLSGSRRAQSNNGKGLVFGALFVTGSIVFVAASPQLSNLGQTSFDNTYMSRASLAEGTLQLIQDDPVFGTGLGSFEHVFPLTESPGQVTRIFAPHAHNDYLQTWLELGLPGVLLIALALAWWGHASAQLWLGRVRKGSRLGRAASIATLVPILHSLVDYPFRTPAICVAAALAMALVIHTRTDRKGPDKDGSSPGSKHLNL